MVARPRRISLQGLARDEYQEVVADAVALVASGGVLLYPTDTVYGLGGDATNRQAVARICEVKGRDPAKSMLSMVAHVAMLRKYAKVTPLAFALADRFLPGPLSVILESTGTLASELIGPLGAGFRIPDHALCLDLVRLLGRPVVTTSANRSGLPQPQTLDAILAGFGEQLALVDLVLDAGTLPASSPSTLLDARGEKAVLLREGVISKETLAAYL